MIFAAPHFLTRFLIRPYRENVPPHVREFEYGAWMVANLFLKDRPQSRGFPLAWDNVIYESQSLGYVAATHQRGLDRGPTVFTYYYPLCDPDPRAARSRLLETTWADWAEVTLTDLTRAHPDIRVQVERLDVMRWGHAMIRPRPGFIWSEARKRASQPYRGIHFAHSDLSGVALFEEAFYQGIRAADEVLAARGRSCMTSSTQRAVDTKYQTSDQPASLSAPRAAWLFSRRVDLSVFLGSALVSLVALWVGAQTGVLYDDTPDWAWVPAVLLIDVAHVYATGFRVYLDSEELRRRPWLYALVPLLGYALGVALYSEGELVFWRALAYLAVFHFIRQQYGWVALYRARAGRARHAWASGSIPLLSMRRRSIRSSTGTPICRASSGGSSQKISLRCPSSSQTWPRLFTGPRLRLTR